jgi:hypothetical protein
MGDQLSSTLRYNGKASTGTALLETAELLFRGEPRLKIPFSEMLEVCAEGRELRVRTREGEFTFDVGAKGAVWREKILHPKSLLDKLGVKSGDAVALFGEFPAEFLADLKAKGAVVSKSKAPKDASTVFLAADSLRDLQRVKMLGRFLRGATGLWIVYPKRQKSIPESEVRKAGLAAGLTDIKAASFSATHTALKFVVPKALR